MKSISSEASRNSKLIRCTGDAMTDIAWTYHDPKEKAVEIKDFVAFYVGKVDGE